MKMDLVANSGNDEFYTPEYAIDPIMKHIPAGSKIWCPFDTEESLFVQKFSRGGVRNRTHISNGEDFFQLEVPECDYIISNPPYSVKGDVLQRLFDIGKPFAMLVGVVGLFESQKLGTRFAAQTLSTVGMEPETWTSCKQKKCGMGIFLQTRHTNMRKNLSNTQWKLYQTEERYLCF